MQSNRTATAYKYNYKTHTRIQYFLSLNINNFADIHIHFSALCLLQHLQKNEDY